MRDNVGENQENLEIHQEIQLCGSTSSDQSLDSIDLETRQSQSDINDTPSTDFEDKSTFNKILYTPGYANPEIVNCKYEKSENIVIVENYEISFSKNLNFDTSEIHHALPVKSDICNSKFSIIPASLEHLIEGCSVLADPSDINNFSPPSWFDLEKYKLGQQFAQTYFYGLCYAEMLSLILLFSFKDSVDPLIFTKKSSTPFTAFRRYLSTVDRVRSWYRTDVFDPATPGHKNISTVRLMHRSIRQRMNIATPEDMSQRTKIEDRELCCPLLSHLREDTKNIIPPKSDESCPYLTSDSQIVYVNQFDMSITQFAFVGLMILNPEKFGAVNASEKELDGFVHLWAVLGYLLGIQDKYNFCIGGLHECQIMSQDAIKFWFIPNFGKLSGEWEHMSSCVVEGISYYIPENKFASSLVYLCWVLNIPVPKLQSVLSWWTNSLFSIHRFIFCTLARLPGQNIIHNWLLNRRIDNALNASDTWIKNKEKRSQAFIEKYNSINCRSINPTSNEKFQYTIAE